MWGDVPSTESAVQHSSMMSTQSCIISWLTVGSAWNTS